MTTTSGALVQGQIASLQVMKTVFDLGLRGDLEPVHVIFQAAGSRSHILWVLGHTIWFFDAIAIPTLGGSSVLPARYNELFRTGSQPVADLSAYPSLNQLREDFETALSTTISLLESKQDADLAEPLPEGSPLAPLFPDKRGVVPFGVFHTGYHVGQISTLRRLQGLPTGFGF